MYLTYQPIPAKTNTTTDMQNINTIARLNAQQRADHENSRKGTFCVLRHGGVLLRNGVRSLVLDDPKEATEFIKNARGKHSGLVRKLVESYFQKELQLA
jgi:hypothetical protein